MARTIRSSDALQKRVDRIAGCTQCKGIPVTSETNLQGMQIKYCTTCMEVISYSGQEVQYKKKKEEIPIKIKEEVTNKQLELIQANQPNVAELLKQQNK